MKSVISDPADEHSANEFSKVLASVLLNCCPSTVRNATWVFANVVESLAENHFPEHTKSFKL